VRAKFWREDFSESGRLEELEEEGSRILKLILLIPVLISRIFKDAVLTASLLGGSYINILWLCKLN
jgi:hypothetical protein